MMNGEVWSVTGVWLMCMLQTVDNTGIVSPTPRIYKNIRTWPMAQSCWWIVMAMMMQRAIRPAKLSKADLKLRHNSLRARLAQLMGKPMVCSCSAVVQYSFLDVVRRLQYLITTSNPFCLQVVRQRIWVRSATGNERLFSNNAIQVLMNTMKETFGKQFCSERAIESAFMNG